MARQRSQSHSLRRRLLGSVMTAIMLAAVFQGISAYRGALRQADAMFDYHLQQMAFALRGGPPLAVPMLEWDLNRDMGYVIQIWGPDGAQLFQSNRLAMPPRAVLGFSDTSLGGMRYRVFSVQTPTQTIQIAQDMGERAARARALAVRAVFPMVVIAPLLMLALWWVIRRSLGPLERTRRQVAARAVDDLSALPQDGLPDEVRPLVQEINLLFGRVKTAVDAQRSFVAHAAHELRSPLTALKLQAQALARSDDVAVREQALARLNQGIDRAIRLMQQLLVLARQESPGDAVAASNLDLHDLVQSAVAGLLPQARARGIDLGLRPARNDGAETANGIDDTFDADGAQRAGRATVRTVEQAPPATVHGEAEALLILLRNLLENALKYTPAPGRVDIQLRTHDAGVVLTVEDSGPGIAPEERVRVFDRFYRGASDRDGVDPGGSGLGLAIVRTIATRHQARVTLGQSDHLGGLRVEVHFPALPPMRAIPS